MPDFAPPTGPLLDLAKGVGMMGSADALKRILATVATSMAQSLPQIDAALQAGDVPSADALLHALKGYMPIFAADALAEQVTRVEKIAKTAPIDVVAPLYAELAPQLRALLAEVQAHLAA